MFHSSETEWAYMPVYELRQGAEGASVGVHAIGGLYIGGAESNRREMTIQNRTPLSYAPPMFTLRISKKHTGFQQLFHFRLCNIFNIFYFISIPVQRKNSHPVSYFYKA